MSFFSSGFTRSTGSSTTQDKSIYFFFSFPFPIGLHAPSPFRALSPYSLVPPKQKMSLPVPFLPQQTWTVEQTIRNALEFRYKKPAWGTPMSQAFSATSSGQGTFLLQQQHLHPKVSSQLLIPLVKSLLGILFLFCFD